MQVISYLLNADSADRPIHWLVTAAKQRFGDLVNRGTRLRYMSAHSMSPSSKQKHTSEAQPASPTEMRCHSNNINNRPLVVQSARRSHAHDFIVGKMLTRLPTKSAKAASQGPQNCSFPWGGSGPHPTHGSSGPLESIPNGIKTGSAALAQLTCMTHTQTTLH